MEVHRSRYEYLIETFKSTKEKLTIICKTHGEFYQTGAHHLQGRGCPKCNAGSSGKDPTVAIDDLKLLYPNLDFSSTKFVASTKPVTVHCPKHGKFNAIYSYLLKGVGCPGCSRDSRKTSKIELINRFYLAHGSTYDYSEVPDVIDSTDSYVNIRCKIHGVFSQRHRKHSEGQGCPSCAGRNSNVFYILNAGQDTYKFGVTSSHRIAERFKANLKDSNLPLIEMLVLHADNARELEKEALALFTVNPFKDETFVGHTEYRVVSEIELQNFISTI